MKVIIMSGNEEENVPSTPTKRKQTPGEELYLIHLRRQNQHPYPEGVCHLEGEEVEVEEEDDHDYEIPRKRSRSVGEELWKIYLKRSEGLEPDYDTYPGEDNSNNEAGGKSARDSTKTNTQKNEHHHVMNLRGNKDLIISDQAPSGVLNLRNRDVPLHH